MTQLTKEAYPSQCASMAIRGESYVYMTSTSESWELYTDHITEASTIYAVPVNGFNIQMTTTEPPTTLATASATKLAMLADTKVLHLAAVSETDTIIKSTPSVSPEVGSETTSSTIQTPSWDIAVGIGVGVGIGLLILILVCVPIYKSWGKRQQNARKEIYNKNEALPPQQHENPFQVYQQPIHDIQPPSDVYYQPDDVKEDSYFAHNRERRTAIFEMSDKRQTDSWVKGMMEANQEELWMESPIRY